MSSHVVAYFLPCGKECVKAKIGEIVIVFIFYLCLYHKKCIESLFMKKTLNLTELAKHTGIPKRTLFDMIRNKRFPVEPIVKTTPRRWSVEQIDEWLKGKK